MRPLPALIFCLASALPAAAAPAAQPVASDLAAVRAAEARRAQAVAKRDVNALRDLIGGAYYHVETNGRVRSKTEFLQLLTRDDYEFLSYDVDGTEVTLLDKGRTALVTGRLVAQTRSGNRPGVWRGRYVRVWTLQPEGWRNTLHQSTEIRPLSLSRDNHASLPLSP